MALQILGKTIDQRTNANVIYCKCTIDEYLSLIGSEFGGFSIQRKREAHRAYSRLKSDLVEGALLPSITLALKHHLVPSVIKNLENQLELTNILSQSGNLDILDGLQRTYIMKEIKDSGGTFKSGQELLLEFWVEPDMGRLIYRMIVLNAGQKAMSMRHQIELLFMSLKGTIVEKINGIEIFTEKDELKRDCAGKYSLGDVASAYQAFMTKTTELDKANVVADGMNRDNILDSTETEITEKFDRFLQYFNLFKDIDSKAWAFYGNKFNEKRYREIMSANREGATVNTEDNLELENLKAMRAGIKWLGSSNAMLSIFCALSMLDDSGRKERVEKALESLSRKFDDKSADPIGIEVYEKIRSGISPRVSNVGQATRRLIFNGFKEFLIDEGVIELSALWPQAAD
tara:strand:- start:1100 stop:2305 length:1206 start_codon:yes stop_codon:yes gene_type:complete